jgi:hypothetical protein
MSSVSPAPSLSNRGTPSKSGEANVSHSFDGDVKILNGTFDSRMEIRRNLTHLHSILQKSEGRPVQVCADIKIRIAGPDAKGHIYSVSVNNSDFDAEAFAKQISGSKSHSKAVGAASTPVSTNGGALRPASSAVDDDDVVEVRPFKKARTDTADSAPFTPRAKDTDGLLREALALLKQRNSNDSLEFMKQWHTEWVKQGGWLFDMLNKAEKATKDNHVAVQNRIASAQDVLGQSLNAASASTMAELANIAKLVPWLEHCRKTAADKVQAREEKWRTSSATFHDQSRRDRENAEKKLEEELQRQRALLIKIAEANGVDVDEEEEKDDGRNDREASLGAQLTAELNMEARRAEAADKPDDGKPKQTIQIDDDEDGDGGK